MRLLDLSRVSVMDHGGHPILKSYLEGIKDFNILYLGSEADAEKLVSEGRLNGAVILEPGEVRVLLDATSLHPPAVDHHATGGHHGL